MKNVYLITGPSGVGKTTIADGLEARYGYKSIKSYTTRPPRYEGEKSHIFVSSEEFAKRKVIAHNIKDGYEYGISPQMLDTHDIFVVEPSGIIDVKRRYRGKGIKVITLALDEESIRTRLKNRGDSDASINQRLVEESYVDFQSLADVVINVENKSVDELACIVAGYIEMSEH